MPILPPSFPSNSPLNGGPAAAFGVAAAAPPVFNDEDNFSMSKLEQLVLNLNNINLREDALLQLSMLYKMRREEFYEVLPPLVWNSFGTIFALLQEIISVYRNLTTLELTQEQSTRVYHAILIFQAVASHPETRMLFLNANIPCYLYPFLDMPSTSSPLLENLRTASLSVVAALTKAHDIIGLLNSEVIPHCLQSMNRGSLKSQVFATTILLKVLTDNEGLDYICTTKERFDAVGNALTYMVTELAQAPSIIVGELSGKLLLHIIGCYFKLSTDQRACAALQSCLPNMLTDGTFNKFLHENSEASLFITAAAEYSTDELRFATSWGGYDSILMK